MVEPINLQVKESEGGGSVLWLDKKQLKLVESYEIKSSTIGEGLAELSLKMLVRFPPIQENA